MLSFRSLVGVAAALALAVLPIGTHAQGVTTGAITGTVTDESGQGIEGVQIEIRNPATGFAGAGITRSSGLYSIQGLLPASGYEITARRIGFSPVTRTGIQVSLGQARREDFALTQAATVLTTATVTATVDPIINASKTGTGTSISDSALSRLPTLNRNFQDFVQLVPQVSTTTGLGLSGAGVNIRQNAIQIDGAQSGDMFGLGASGQPGSQANAKSIPLDAVKEYQVLLSPFDVRQGNFGGLLINAVTKSGTNEYEGSIYGYTRNESFTRSRPYLNDYSQQQYGGTFGGPILKDRLFFFGAGEIQRRQTPTSGSYIGSPDQYVTQGSIDSLAARLVPYGLSNPGSGEQLQIQNPNRNFFGRIDAYLPWQTRLVLRHNYAAADRTSFGRASGATSTNPFFNLTSNRYEFSSTTNSTVAEFLSSLPRGMFNELLLNYSTTKDFRTVPVSFPQLTVGGIQRINPATGAPITGQSASFVLGTESSSQGNSLDQRTFELTNNLTIPVGAHSITLGTKNIFYKSINLFASNSLGNWTFASPADLSNGIASRYQVSAPAPTDPYNGLATIRANMYGVYLQDVWTATPELTISAGVRYDKPDFQNVPPENEIVFTQYGRHTSSVPTKGQVSPRIGFNWDVTGDQMNQLRGGIGSFAGGVPFVYLSNAFGNSGLSGFSSITCTGAALTNTSTTSLLVPAFTTDAASNPPLACRSGTRPDGTIAPGAAISGPAASANVATIDPNFRYPKYLKANLGYDRRLPYGIVATIEGLYSKAQNSVFYQNLALVGPVMDSTSGTPVPVFDRDGRVLYGRLTTTGAVANTKGTRTQVLDVSNSSGDYTYSLTGQLQKSFSDNFEGSAAYTFMRARDVVSTTSSTQGSNFRYQRSVSGRLDDMTVTRSKYDQPHRIIATGTYRFPTLTDLSVIYTGNSGSPYDYVYAAPNNGGTRGDLNGDGQTQNDLVYVPTDATDQAEILFTGYNNADPAVRATAAAMATAFESFIENTECLNAARGRILTRNACRNPWVNQFDISIAQSIAAGWLGNMHNLQARLDIINFGNLLNKKWGAQAFSDQNATCGSICSATTLLEHNGFIVPTGSTASPTSRGTFTFNPAYKAFNSENLSSNYTMQFSLRYSF